MEIYKCYMQWNMALYECVNHFNFVALKYTHLFESDGYLIPSSIFLAIWCSFFEYFNQSFHTYSHCLIVNCFLQIISV